MGKRKADDEQQKPKNPRKAARMAIKTAARARRKNMYLLQFGKTDDNKRRKLERQIRYFPEDEQAAQLFAKRYPNKKLPAPSRTATARHRKLLERKAAKARAA